MMGKRNMKSKLFPLVKIHLLIFCSLFLLTACSAEENKNNGSSISSSQQEMNYCEKDAIIVEDHELVLSNNNESFNSLKGKHLLIIPSLASRM